MMRLFKKNILREIDIHIMYLISRIFFLLSICRLIVLTIAAVDLVPSLQLDDIDPKDEDVNVEDSGGDDGGQKDFLQCLLGFLCTWSLAILVEGALVISSLRGTILEDELRWHSEYLLYIKLGTTITKYFSSITKHTFCKEHIYNL